MSGAEYYGIKSLKRFDAWMLRTAIKLCYGRLKRLRSKYRDAKAMTFADYETQFIEIALTLNEYMNEYDGEFNERR